MVKKDQDLNKAEKRLQSEKQKVEKEKKTDRIESPGKKGRDQHE